MITTTKPRLTPKLAPKLKFVAISSPIRPKCQDCKYYMNGTCTLFKYSTVPYIEYIPITEARFNELLCGPDGRYFKDSSLNIK
jgi:hypothetical protein